MKEPVKITKEELEKLEKEEKQRQEEDRIYWKSLKREDHKTKCADCGKFVDKECWAPKTSKKQPLCHSCANDYDWYF